MNTEFRVYCLDTQNISNDKGFEDLTDEEWIDECEKQGKVYTLEGFQKAFNEEEVNVSIDVVKILKMNNTKNLSLAYDNLENEVNNRFYKLLDKVEKYPILFKEDEQDTSYVYHDYSGDIVSVFITKIYEDGTIQVEEVLKRIQYTIPIHSFNCILDKIILIELLEEKINKTKQYDND